MNASEARSFLRQRYALQCERFPRLSRQIPESLYVSRNLRHVMAMHRKSLASLLPESSI